MERIIIRCDASTSIGSGHVMRCLSLGRWLRHHGGDVVFVCRRQPGDLINLIEHDFDVLSLPEQPLAECEGLNGQELYSAWLGCSQEQDATECLQTLSKAGITRPSWLVADHYALDANWEALMLVGLAVNIRPKLLVIDDLANRSHHADLLLDQNFFGEATASRYLGLVPPHCTLLLGPHYAIMGPEYTNLHSLLPVRTELRRVFVFFGGVDSYNLTSRALEALMDPQLAYLTVDVVLGSQSPHRKAVEELVAQRNNTTLHEPMPSLAGLIARADLAIGAGGTTTWERACLGLPSIVIAIGANQLACVEALAKAGHVQFLGDSSSAATEQIRSALVAKITEALNAEAGSSLTDGWGAARLAMAMLGPRRGIHLRHATAADEALLLRWANDPQVRANSFSPEQITSAVHHHWFQKGLADPNRLMFIALGADGCPIGQVRFDRQPATDERQLREARIGLSIDRCARGHGLSSEIVRLGLMAMVKYWGGGTDIVAKVLADNIASNACFARAGFVKETSSVTLHAPQTVNSWRWSPSD